MSRGGAKFWWGIEPPKEVHHYFKDSFQSEWQIITWRDIFDERKKKQDNRLNYKRSVPVVKPAFVWVFYNDSWIMGGWWIYIKTLRADYAINFRNDRDQDWQIQKIMELFPCGMLPLKENLKMWAAAFAKQYHQKAFGRTKQGLAKCRVEIFGNSITNIF